MTDKTPDAKTPTVEDGMAHMQRAMEALRKARDTFHGVYSADLDRLEHLECVNLAVNAGAQVENFMAKARNVMQEAERRRQQAAP